MGQMENSNSIQGERPRVMETSNPTKAGRTRLGGSSQGSWDYPGSARGKESACSAADPGEVPGLGRSPGGGRGDPPSIVAWRPHGQRSLAGYRPRGHRVGHNWSDLARAHSRGLWLFCRQKAWLWGVWTYRSRHQLHQDQDHAPQRRTAQWNHSPPKTNILRFCSPNITTTRLNESMAKREVSTKRGFSQASHSAALTQDRRPFSKLQCKVLLTEARQSSAGPACEAAPTMPREKPICVAHTTNKWQTSEQVTDQWMAAALVLATAFWKLLVIAVVQPLIHVRLSATPWTAARQAPLSFTISQSLRKFTFIESVTPSNHLILCRPLSSCPQCSPASGSCPVSQLIRWPKYWSFSFSTSPSLHIIYTEKTCSHSFSLNSSFLIVYFKWD